MKETDIIDRGFLIELRRAAEGMAAGNLNPAWVRAYLALADAADRLDAMISRSSVPAEDIWQPGPPPPTEEPAGQTC
jgi:hypothetical protein